MQRYDVAILGAGFAGSLLGLILARAGKSVVLLERGSHPRFALGESSTPLANLILADLARTYDLPRLAPLAKYGPWKKTYPDLVCGLKRGFTFVKHLPHQPFTPCPTHSNELLVAASPRDEVADTHWLRADIDHFLVREAIEAGVDYRDRVEITSLQPGERWRVSGTGIDLETPFLVDATGPAGVVAKVLGIETKPEAVRTNSWSIYSHFTGVRLWEDVLREQGGSVADHPFPCDAAALHHVLEDGWIWVLRFDNGVTSAGVLYDSGKRLPSDGVSPAEQWADMLQRYPSLNQQFGEAKPIIPWVITRRIQRRACRVAGENWAMLASSAYSLDALFSTGNAHALLTVQRLARLLTEPGDRRQGLREYERALLGELDFIDRLVAGSYRAFTNFRLLAAWTMYYFAGAIAAEERRMRGGQPTGERFLFSDVAGFRAAVEAGYGRLGAAGIEEFEEAMRQDIAPWNTVGLGEVWRRNMYPYS